MNVADPWWVRESHPNGIAQHYEPHVHRIIRGNVWHVEGRDRDLVVDTSVGVASAKEAMSELLDKPVVCVATHIHYDHVGCLHEFDERLMHPIAAEQMDPYQDAMPLRWSAFPPEAVDLARQAGYVIGDDAMLDALPREGFDVDGFRTTSVAATGTVDEGDVIDLGDRRFSVLHLPGHTPGSIGLWEEETATLFSGDAVYDGPLIDNLPDSDLADYRRTMKRLRELPAEVVHAGHDPSFGRERLIELADQELARG